ncbi:MAG: hypothetical protein V4491_00130 [Pseudomonadota bacterium]
MSAGRSFRSLFMAATCAGAALGCYLVSLRVASERAALENVEGQIVMAQRDVRVLQTEIGTRGRLAQLERWNVKVLALSAPTADQFLSGSFELAKLARPDDRPVIDAPVVLAAAPAPDTARAIGLDDRDDSGQSTGAARDPARTLSAKAMLNEASLKTETREVPAKPAPAPGAAGRKSVGQPATAAKPVSIRPTDRPGLAAAKSSLKKPVDKAGLTASKPVTKLARVATADPLAPLSAGRKPAMTHKDSATPQ